MHTKWNRISFSHSQVARGCGHHQHILIWKCQMRKRTWHRRTTATMQAYWKWAWCRKKKWKFRSALEVGRKYEVSAKDRRVATEKVPYWWHDELWTLKMFNTVHKIFFAQIRLSLFLHSLVALGTLPFSCACTFCRPINVYVYEYMYTFPQKYIGFSVLCEQCVCVYIHNTYNKFHTIFMYVGCIVRR